MNIVHHLGAAISSFLSLYILSHDSNVIWPVNYFRVVLFSCMLFSSCFFFFNCHFLQIASGTSCAIKYSGVLHTNATTKWHNVMWLFQWLVDWTLISWYGAKLFSKRKYVWFRCVYFECRPRHNMNNERVRLASSRSTCILYGPFGPINKHVVASCCCCCCCCYTFQNFIFRIFTLHLWFQTFRVNECVCVFVVCLCFFFIYAAWVASLFPNQYCPIGW